MPDDAFNLARFVSAQDTDGAYERAMTELRAGPKQSHWMWFIFPQVAGLGRSEAARTYAISGLDEARAYLAHPVLGERLRQAVILLVTLGERDPVRLLGSPLDAQKLCSSMTLFAMATAAEDDWLLFRAVIVQYFLGVDDARTATLLGV